MGLDTTHDCWHGTYSAFHRWRVKLAEKIGLPLDQMEGHDGAFKWSLLNPDPVHALLHHPDCDGELAVDVLIPLAERLEELAELMGNEDGGWHIGSYREKTLQFAKGCRAAAAAGEVVEFR